MMSELVWYYVDVHQQRQGPVSAAEVADAYARGDTTGDCLAWREGLADWVPLAQFRDDLGLAAPATPAPVPTPAPAYATYAPPAAAPPKSNRGCLVAGLVIGGVRLVGIIGILAAIAMPAYNDYVTRTKVAMAVAQGRAQQPLVDTFVANTDRCPRDNEEVDLPAPTDRSVASITLGEANTGMCTIDVELAAIEGEPDLEGAVIRLSRDGIGEWYCTSDLMDRAVLPMDCR